MFNRTALVVGALFGLVAPFVGLFIGLQISPVLADVLMWPVLLLSKLVGEPFGNWGWPMIVLAVVISIALWALVFGLLGRLLSRNRLG